MIKTGHAVETYLREQKLTALTGCESLIEAIDDCLSDIGLLIRSYLLRVAYEERSGTFDSVLPIAGGIELIQLSTLVIDDVLDRSPIRNGRESVFAKWGAERAVATGTVMSSMGFALVSQTLEADPNLENALSIIKLLTLTHRDIYAGQFMDLSFEGDIAVSEEQYFETIRRTTASFIGAPLVIGAMLWDAPKDAISALEEAGLKLGLAYQIRDDVIDIIGDPECTGKPEAMDIQDRKMRLPAIHAFANLNPVERDRLRFLWDDSDGAGESKIGEIISLFEFAGSIQYSIESVKRFCSQADATIEKLRVQFPMLTDRLRAVSSLIVCFDGD